MMNKDFLKLFLKNLSIAVLVFVVIYFSATVLLNAIF